MKRTSISGGVRLASSAIDRGSICQARHIGRALLAADRRIDEGEDHDWLIMEDNASIWPGDVERRGCMGSPATIASQL